MFGQCRKIKKIRKVKEHNNHALPSHRQEIIATDISIYSVTKLRICMAYLYVKQFHLMVLMLMLD